MDLDALRQHALSLPVEKRAELAEALLSSLESLSSEELDQLWFQEAARRAEEIDRGTGRRIPAEEVRRQAQALLK
jgi:putative addiction module component (TIGR02574 family)